MVQDNDSEANGQVYDVVLYLGIIDILQEYNIRKKSEHAYKSIQYNSIVNICRGTQFLLGALPEIHSDDLS